MLYHFLVPLAKDHILFNFFSYLSFWSFMALVSGLVTSLVIGPPLIQKLRELQHGGETIREDTPERHRTKKGTPTMGGIVIITAILSTTLLWANLGNRYVWVAMLATLGFGLLGVWDDLTKLRLRKGLSMRLKFGVQVVLTGALHAKLQAHRKPLPQAKLREVVPHEASPAEGAFDAPEVWRES